MGRIGVLLRSCNKLIAPEFVWIGTTKRTWARYSCVDEYVSTCLNEAHQGGKQTHIRSNPKEQGRCEITFGSVWVWFYRKSVCLSQKWLLLNERVVDDSGYLSCPWSACYGCSNADSGALNVSYLCAEESQGKCVGLNSPDRQHAALQPVGIH